MSKICFVIFFLELISIRYGYSQNTYYYKFTKKIQDGVEYTNTAGGQFISFIQGECYDSDKYGIPVGNGKLTFEEQYSNSSKIYLGKSYFGNVEYRFKPDLSVLNIIVNKNLIYVYKRTTAPEGVTTCSLIRKSKTTGGGGYYPTQPVYNGNLSQPIPNSNTSINNGTNSTQTIKSREPKQCGACNGRGWVPETKGVSSFGLSDKWCNECNRTVPANHYHATCPSCKGKGYW